LSVNANTVARVYADLERAGLLETRRGVGTFVAAHPPAAAGRRKGAQPALRALVRRCLDEASARGFSAEDIVRQIEQLTANAQGG